ncbi:MAG: nodulation protein NfeD [Candidatus Krumholzibacteriota bacterium]
MSVRLPGKFIPTILFLLIFSMCAAAEPEGGRASEVHLATFEGPITPVAAEFLVQSISGAESEGAIALVIQLDTPGGLDTSMRDIVKAQLGAQIPVIVYVAPAGSRAASAGAFITLAGHVAAMAPGTNIGSASPVQMGGAGMDSTMAHKVTNDAAAYIASIAAGKERNEEVARTFVTEAVNLTAAEALEQGIIEVVAPNLPALLDSLQGREVVLDGRTLVLETAAAGIIEKTMSSRQKLLKALANPNLAYILMMLGIYGLFFELSNPGSLVPGILGGICLLLALFAFQTLPVDYTGVALILLGVIMLILEIKVPSFGALSIGGVTALVFGSLMIFDSTQEWARLSMRVLIPTVIVFSGFFILCIWLVVRAQKRPVTTGLKAMIGETGRLVQGIESSAEPGKMVCHGEIWDAMADGPLDLDSHVRVVAVEGRVVQVVSEAPSDNYSAKQRS